MVTVLRRLERSGLLAKYTNLLTYIARGAARPAYQRAFAAQLADFKTTSSTADRTGINGLG
jgi:glutathione S-transferase